MAPDRLQFHGYFSPLFQCLCEAGHDEKEKGMLEEAAYCTAAKKTGVEKQTKKQRYREIEKYRETAGEGGTR